MLHDPGNWCISQRWVEGKERIGAPKRTTMVDPASSGDLPSIVVNLRHVIFDPGCVKTLQSLRISASLPDLSENGWILQSSRVP